ncbi:MAG: low molecular weight phosphotyrosine protein phosphatase [Muribaculaceae bacterium]|nr:low molecular weight phosphotyrosine protein phosphatase [Muribaculaceae bacterium]
MENKDIVARLRDEKEVRILFVCLGNICRSPAAEGIMRDMVENEGLQGRFVLDSAGLYSGHAGELPDQRMRVHARRRGYELTHRSRPVRSSDFDDFDLIVAMDNSNYDRLRGFAPTVEGKEKVVRMIDFVKTHPGYDYIPDPYYEGAEGFEIVLDLLEDGCRNLMEELRIKD